MSLNKLRSSSNRREIHREKNLKLLPPTPSPRSAKETWRLGKQKFTILVKNRELEPFYLNRIWLLSTDINIYMETKGCRCININFAYPITRAFVAGNFDKNKFLSIIESLIFIYKEIFIQELRENTIQDCITVVQILLSPLKYLLLLFKSRGNVILFKGTSIYSLFKL